MMTALDVKHRKDEGDGLDVSVSFLCDIFSSRDGRIKLLGA